MSQENVEIVRRFYPGTVELVATVADPEGFEATRAAWEPFVHHDFETVTSPRTVPLATADGEIPQGSRPTFRGLDGFATGFRDWLSAWESWVVTPTEFIDVDEDRVLVLIAIRGRSKTHHVEMPIEAANLWILRNRKVVRLELFLDQEDGLEAAGLSE
jgi:hypothetical protein